MTDTAKTTEEFPYDTYMVVVAHPDDLEFSCGGTIAKLGRLGKRIVLVQVTSGNRGTSDRNVKPEEISARRELEEAEAAKRLNIAEVVFLRYPDGEVPHDIALRGDIVRQIRKHQPDVVITHDGFRPYALHPDHRNVGMATTDAVYPCARDPWAYPEHFEEGFDTWKVAELWFTGPEHPDKFVDITDSIDGKIDALKAHVTQVGDGETLMERLAERAREVAQDQPFEMAEAFKVVQLRR